jgi:phage tail sheath protein FI
VNATLPQYPDAIITFDSPAPATDPLGISTTPAANINVAHYALGTGNGTVDSWGSYLTSANPGTDGSGLPWTQDLIGDPSLNSGIYALSNVDIFNLLSIPDATRALPGNSSAHDPNVDYNAVYSAAIALCDTKRAMLLIDAPPEVNNILAAVDWKSSGLIVNDENGACFFPRLRLLDPLNPGMLRTFAPSGVVAGVYATTDSNRGVWKAPAGIQATLNGVQSLVYKMTDAENGELNPLGVNCFRTFPVYGSVLWGARTLVGADADANQWKYVPVRRTALFLEQSLYQGTQWVVFEPNDEPLWASIRLNIGSFMQTLFLQGAFQGSTPAQAYFVKCDSETTTQTDIDNGIVNILVGFAPLKPAEFVVIQIQQMAGSQPS